MTRLRAYVAGSAVLANVVLLRAYYERPNFYSAAVYISQSTGSLMFLINLGLIITAAAGYGLQRLFYGPLRAIEAEQLYDKAWFAVSETLLAMTIFRDDIGFWFFAMFLGLLAGKMWQWIGEGRVEQLEQQPPANPRLFHARLMSSLLLSVAFDIFMMNYCFDSILQEARPGVMVMFGFEYVLLAIASLSTLLRYHLSIAELVITHRQEKAQAEARRLAREQAAQRATTEGGAAEPPADEDDDEDLDVPGWEEKGRWVFYLELATDFIKSVVYVGFFMILMAFYGIPIHIMRDLFVTIRSFIKRCNDFVKYRNATRDMNARYPDATADELARENTCIVCREEMRPWTPPGEAQAGRRIDERQRPKKLPCGHILHFSCLRSWLERQQVCPTCRRPVLAETPPPNGQQNNAANQGQPNQQNPPVAPPFGGLFGAHPQNPPQPQAGAPNQQGHQPQQDGQPNRPVGNMRVFNLGPLRIALGNIRVPAQVAQEGNAPDNNIMLRDMVQQLVQNPNQAQQQNPPQTQPTPQAASNQEAAPIPTAQASHPLDIQSDILRLQQNVIDSLRVLHAQNDQLEYVHALLGELNRLQVAAGVAPANGQGSGGDAVLNQPLPQHYTATGAVLHHGDQGLPAGVVLPEGWTLRPLVAVAPRTNVGVAGVTSSQSVNPATPGSETTATAPSSALATPARTETPEAASSSPGTQRPAESTSPTDRATQPRSLESSWSFGDADAAGEASGSSSAVATSSSGGQGVSRRTATVEDSEENSEA